MTIKRSTPILVTVMLLFSVLACTLPPLGGQAEVPAEQQTLQAVGTRSAEETAAAQAGQDETSAPVAATEEPESAEATSEPTIAPTIEHVTFPGSPGSISSFMTDRSTRPLASEGRAIADNFDQLLFERPFSAEAMEYKGYLDITRGEISAGSPWFYVIIHLEESAPEGTEPFYGVEIDIDKDGRGDWLIWGLVPPDTEWTTDGVQALQDTNNDVGESTPVIANSPPQSGDGYDNLVFDAGIGPDPDAAWIRRAPNSPTQIHLAFKQTLLGAPGEFLWGVWADEGPQNPAFFDYNDHWNLSQAGSPVSNTSYYPLKELAMVDNSCRWGYGFEPDGSEPGTCYIPPTPTPSPTPSPVPQGSISGFTYRGGGSSPSSDRLSGVTVTLGTGSCSSSGYGSTSTSGSGAYSFNQLAPGTYCVTVIKSSLPSNSYGWATMYPGGFSPTINPSQTVTIGPDENRTGVNFAFLEIVG
jgi:hypothetical protein